MKFELNTNYELKAKLQSKKDNGKVVNHRGFVDAATWPKEKAEFLYNYYKFDSCKGTRIDDVIVLRCHRNAGKPGTNGKEMNITFYLTIVK